MNARAKRRQLLLSTATLIGALSGYGRSAEAACPPAGGVCSGANLTTQTVNAPNATVTTDNTFSVDTTIAGGNALIITGAGAISYTDANASPLTAPNASDTALDIRSTGDIGGNGSVTADTSGALTGGQEGIHAQNDASGTLNITANGDVTGNVGHGIYALNHGADLTVTTGAVTGGATGNGIDARNGTAAANAGAGISIMSAGPVAAGQMGIIARNFGTAAISIVAEDTVTVTGGNLGDQWAGIFAQNGYLEKTGGSPAANTLYRAGTNISITANDDVSGFFNGVVAYNYGSGYSKVHVTGDVTGAFQAGIFARNGAVATPVTYAVYAGTYVSIESEGKVTGLIQGIRAGNHGTAHLKITALGDVVGQTEHGILAYNSSAGTYLTIDAANVSGGTSGIEATNNGSGALTITASGDVTGGSRDGILAENSGTNLTLTTGAGSTITGGYRGIDARNSGSGALTITASGDVSGTTSTGIRARNYAGTDLTVTTAAGTTITGGLRGIDARNTGSGALTITANGDVTGATSDGILAVHENGGPIDITIGSSATVTSNGNTNADVAIDVFYGPGSITVAGTLNGAAGGAVRFDQTDAFDDRLELHTTAVINGVVLAGTGNDTLAFGGTGDGNFDLSDIDTGGNTQQYRDFEIFEVGSGAWSFSGATTQAFTVNGGTLGGTGTFGDLTIGNGGALAPGNSIGTLTVNGAFTLGAGAIYEVEVNAGGQSDKVIVNGTVNLTGATLNVLAANGDYQLSTDYTIIENDGVDAVTGTFAAITSSLAFLTPTVFYNGGSGNDVVLQLERNATHFSDVANTPNQRAVAGALDRFPTGNGLYLAVANQTAAGARQAFDALSGEIHATVGGVLADDSRYVRDAILGRLMQAGHDDSSLGAAGPQVASLDQNAMALGYDNVAAQSSPLAFWTAAYGAWGDYDGNRNAATADRDLGGFVSGMDASLGGSWRVGLAAGASYASIDVNDRNSSADVESFNLAGYAGGMAGAFALRGGGGWAWNEIDTSRAVIFPGFFERQKASYDADTGQVFGEVAYPTQMGGMSVEPFAGLAYVSVDTDTFAEHGGALASLRGRDTDQNVGYSTLGFRAATTTTWGSTEVTPHLSAAWEHAFNDVTPDAALAFASTGVGFSVNGVPLAENSALIDAGLDFALAENLNAGVSYSGQFGDGVQDNAVKGRLTWLF